MRINNVKFDAYLSRICRQWLDRDIDEYLDNRTRQETEAEVEAEEEAKRVEIEEEERCDELQELYDNAPVTADRVVLNLLQGEK